MFKKKPNLKPFAPLRSSDRRKIANAFIKDLDLSPPAETIQAKQKEPAATETEENATDAQQPSNAPPSFANILLPNNTTSAKFNTFAGPDLRTVNGVIYFGDFDPASDSKKTDQKPLWVKCEEDHPTVYTLWRFPDILPKVLTHDGVMERIYTGADLMIPGVVSPLDENARKGKLVSVASNSNPGVPLAVGVAEIDIASLSQGSGEKGKAVRILHWYGDELWALGGAGKPPQTAGPPSEPPAKELEGLSLSNAAAVSEAPPEAEPTIPELSAKEVDAAYRRAALFGMKLHKESGDVQLKYPLNSSEFISRLVQPYLAPASLFGPNLPNDRVHPSLQMKKTTWKNAGKFLKQLDKEKVLKIKVRNGNEVVVQDIDWEDSAIVNAETYELPTPSDKASKPAAAPAASSSSTGVKSWRIVELFKPSSRFSPIFETVGAGSHSFYQASELTKILYAYVDKEQLVDQKNKRLVTLNPIIANLLLDERKDGSILAAGSVKRDDLSQRFLAGCTSYYSMVPNGEEFSFEKHKPKSGKPPRVNILLEKRQGKKTVTRVSGMEPFGVVPQEIAEELSKVCASSSSVSQLVGSSPKNPVMEVMIQGPQKAAVEKALAARGVDSKWIVVTDKTSGKK